MKDVLSPKELAAAIGVSESSLRRWVDAGLLKISRTVGGHRRIPLAEAVRFIRDSHANVVRPELLGLAPLTTPPAAPQNPDAESQRLYDALLAGDSPLARGIVLSLYVTGTSLPNLFDSLLAPALHRVGELHLHSPKGVLLEHRATDIAIQIVSHLRQLLPTPTIPSDNPQSPPPLAIGGAPSEDVYLLPAQMAAATLADCGYAVQNIGPDTPLDTLAIAADELRPRLVYLSLTSAAAADRLRRDDLHSLADRLARFNALLLVGGQQLLRLRLSPRPNLHTLRSMSELAAFARGSLTPPAPAK
jgi:excisionase family DNA binding protein